MSDFIHFTKEIFAARVIDELFDTETAIMNDVCEFHVNVLSKIRFHVVPYAMCLHFFLSTLFNQNAFKCLLLVYQIYQS